MIGRFSQLGVYRELVNSEEFFRVAMAGGLALSSYLWDTWKGSGTLPGTVIVLASVSLSGLPILWGAIDGLLRRRVNVDELVSLAIIASLIQGEFLTAAVVSLIMVIGSLIEKATCEAARKAVHCLMTLSPDTATVIVQGQAMTRPVSQIRTGDLILVKPGERLPVDATIRKGTTAVDESSVTGEPFPRDKAPGDTVYAGTLNQNGVIEIEATAVGEDTTLGKVIRLVEAAESFKPETIRLIDRQARWFTPLILACAVLVWGLTGEVSRAVTVLIVGCPCALLLAAPTAIVATIGRAARSGILIKGGQYLETAAAAQVILFDKTGTLTEGQPRVENVFCVPGVEGREVLALAACVEQHSSHPLARAVMKAAHYAKIALSQVEEMCAQIGLGVSACVQGRLVEVGSAYVGGGTMNIPLELRQPLEHIKERGATPLVVYRDQRPLGIISVADRIRTTAGETVRQLHSLGLEHIGILSGDHQKSASLVAEAVGVTDAWAGMLPEDKLQVLRDFQKRGKVVLFVGDGINDAPSLAAANVGIAMGAAGTDVALETADIALMHDDISKIPFLVRLSRRMLRVIKWNLVFALFFNAMAIAASGGGWLNPITGALVHNIGSVLVVLSSASIAFTREEGL
ncbi:MAG: cation-translocating P-type ATPase [Deltaproteobacteria bacterium]|nr:cation-translocating P-type ATPase [Deltaproteobacteria bacterium]